MPTATDFRPARPMESADWRRAVIDFDNATASMRAGFPANIERFIRLYGPELRELMEGRSTREAELRDDLEESERVIESLLREKDNLGEAIDVAVRALEKDPPDADAAYAALEEVA